MGRRIPLAPRSIAAAVALGLGVGVGAVGCGGAAPAGIDETGDMGRTSGDQMAARIIEIPSGLDGSEWRWVRASCTEGPLDLSSRGFEARLHVDQDAAGLLLTYDQRFAAESCDVTVVQQATLNESQTELRMEEVARVALPSSPECFGQPEPPRPGEVRRSGRNLEVLVQRSRWCNGFEVTMTYEPAVPSLPSNETLARRYVAHYTRGDAARVAGLFSTASALLESFTTTSTGDPYRHEGRDAIRAYYRDAFAGAPWRAMRIVGLEAGETPQQTVVRWEYMDPRLAAPVAGHDVLTIAAGEIFEAQIVLDGTPQLVGASAGASGEEAP